MKPLQDHLKPDLVILFVGFNPSLRSAEVGHHYANPRNRFWKLLFESGLTSLLYLPEQDETLLTIGYGFTNIVSRPTRTAEEISKEEYTIGCIELKHLIQIYSPKIVCFVGKGVYEQFRQKKGICWGIQPDSTVTGVFEFVVPSSSGLVRMRHQEVLEIYKSLNTLRLQVMKSL